MSTSPNTLQRFCPICEGRFEAAVCPVDGVNTVRLDLTPSDLDDPALGRVFAGRYRVERLLGEGAAGRVYAATQLSLGNEVALKLLHPHHASSANHVRRFYREARAATRLDSQHVMRVLDFGVDDEAHAPFIVMELLRGETLESWLARVSPPPPSEVARVLAQVARALVDAAQAGIVHRDLKPTNIMRVESGDGTELFKVTDFGVAKDMTAAESVALTSHGAAIGTPAYMSPEQITGGEVDQRTDLYALGCILYEMLAGRRPFEGHARTELLTGHLLSPPPPLPDPLPSGDRLPAPLAELLARLLAKNPAERPPDARAVVAVLDAVARSEPAPVRSDSARERDHDRRSAAARPRPPARAPTPAPTRAPTPTPAPTPAPAPTPTPEPGGVLSGLWRWLRRRPLSPAEKLRRDARARRRSWQRHRQRFLAINGGLVGLNLVTAILAGELVPWSLVIIAIWGMFLALHSARYRAWREDNALELAALGIDPEHSPSASPPTLIATPTSTWTLLVDRCRRAVDLAERALHGVDTEAGGGAGSRLELRQGLADIERLAQGAKRLEAVLRDVTPGVAEIEVELARLATSIAASSDARLRSVYESNRQLLLARKRRLEQFEAELTRMRATAEGFLLATENIRLDAARIGAPRLHEYEVSLREPLRRLDDEVEVLEHVEAELAAVERELEEL